MKKEDEQILRAYFKLEEYQGQRLRFERLLHPDEIQMVRSYPYPVPDKESKNR